MRTLSLADAIVTFGRLAVEVQIAELHAMEKSAVVVKREAKKMLGHYQQNMQPLVDWAELADSTKAERVNQGFPENDPLLRDGLLRDNIEHQTFEGAGGHIEAEVGVPSRMVQHSYQKQPVDIGEVAKAQELGTDHIPPRSFLAGAVIHKTDKILEIIGEGAVAALIGEGVFGGSFHIPLGNEGD